MQSIVKSIQFHNKTQVTNRLNGPNTNPNPQKRFYFTKND